MNNPLAEAADILVRACTEPCNYCERPIVWAATGTSRMPVDAPATDGGNVLVSVRDRAHLHAAVLGKSAERAAYRASGWSLRTHHKLTCPFADEWSRPGGPKRGRQNRPPSTTRQGAGQGARRR